MGPNCPNCKKSDFTYRQLLSVHPYRGEFSPVSVTCPSCGAVSRVTAKSRLLAIVLILSFAIAPVVLLAQTAAEVAVWQLGISVLFFLAFYYLVIWPLIVRLTPWTEFEYWLPKSRMVGYFVYLVLPLAALALLVLLAVRLGLGM